MKTNNTAILITVIILCISVLASCNNGSTSSNNTNNNNSTSSNNDNIKSESSETFDTGKISITVPDGWKAFGSSSTDKDSQNSINVFKGAKSEFDMFSKPGIYIYYYGPDTEYLNGSGSFYDDYTEQAPITIGNRTWNYHTYSSIGYPYAELIWQDADKGLTLQLNVLLENKPYKISLDDEDVKAIVESLKITDPAAKL